MVYGFVPIVHIVAVVFSIIELGLTAYDVSVYHGYVGYNGGYYAGGSPSEINFMLFNSIWSLLVLAYIGITPLYMAHLFHKLASLALEVITMIFWFAGSIALAVAVGGPYNCGGDTFCGSVEASIAFGFFLWALFGFLVVLDAIEAMRSRGSTVHTTHQKPAAPYVGA